MCLFWAIAQLKTLLADEQDAIAACLIAKDITPLEEVFSCKPEL